MNLRPSQRERLDRWAARVIARLAGKDNPGRPAATTGRVGRRFKAMPRS